MRHSIAAAAAALLVAAAPAALAQDETTATADQIQKEQEARALKRPRENAPPVGQPAQEFVDGVVNWTEMRTELAKSARRDISANQTVTAAVARPAGMRTASAERFKNVVVREVNLTQLPLLAPEGARIQQTLKVYSLGESYSAVAEVEDGVAMRMSGSRRKLVVGDAKAARARMSTMRAQEKTLASVEAPYIITRSESSTDLSFSKFGAGYVLAIMCDDPATDARCTNDDFIANLAANLYLLNPEAGGE